MASVRIYFPENGSETAKAFAKWHETQQWDLSHLDNRVEQALGHFRQDFQRGFRPMFGFSGSFLPVYNIYTGAPALPAYKIGQTPTNAAAAVRVNFPTNGSEAEKAVQRIKKADKKPLVGDENIQRGVKRPLVQNDERRPLKIRIVFGSQKNATEIVPAKAAVENQSVVGDEQRPPPKIRFVFGSGKRATILS